jgi:hypothetical protein
LGRIIALTSPVKKQTQEYMAQQLISRNAQAWQIFDYQASNANWNPFSIFTEVLFDKTLEYAEDMITKNKVAVERHMTLLILERFEGCVKPN